MQSLHTRDYHELACPSAALAPRAKSRRGAPPAPRPCWAAAPHNRSVEPVASGGVFGGGSLLAVSVQVERQSTV
jgi:hypothetical protein